MTNRLFCFFALSVSVYSATSPLTAAQSQNLKLVSAHWLYLKPGRYEFRSDFPLYLNAGELRSDRFWQYALPGDKEYIAKKGGLSSRSVRIVGALGKEIFELFLVDEPPFGPYIIGALFGPPAGRDIIISRYPDWVEGMAAGFTSPPSVEGGPVLTTRFVWRRVPENKGLTELKGLRGTVFPIEAQLTPRGSGYRLKKDATEIDIDFYNSGGWIYIHGAMDMESFSAEEMIFLAAGSLLLARLDFPQPGFADQSFGINDRCHDCLPRNP
ncbi:MAG: hypothetical protein HY401_01675 [Elusimicrobia bacterium]|nr:hypothetical protein [Elusimicrobiota bacterium]